MRLILDTLIHPSRAAIRDWTRRILASLSTPGLLLATLFFAASLTPSLVPRSYELQGFLSGLSLAAGYGLGVFGRWLWRYLEMPYASARAHRISVIVAGVICATIALLFLRQASEWQNSIRVLMEMEPVDSAHPFRTGAIALVVFAVMLGIGRLFHVIFDFVAGHLHRFIPRRVANVTGVLVAVMVFWAVIDGVILRYTLRAADSSFQQVDARIEPHHEQPADPLLTGSDASLIDWETLGRPGRNFIAGAPTAQEISDFLGEAAEPPLRVYVGLNSDETIEARARLALKELKRVDAFDRSVLVLATPTGRGWVDQGAIDSVEYLHRGDIATVTAQYSYLPSWLSLLAEPEYGADTAEALFNEIYGHWIELPEDERPELYLHGLSLGAMNSERAADLYDIIADPFSGALWSGPPFRSERWSDITRQRQPDSPAWLPKFRDGSIVRFTNQENHLDMPGTRWGPMRIVYLQYASDPVTFFEPAALYRQPAWMNEPRGPDVSPELRWYPVITMLQLGIDIIAGDDAPMGYGHVYAPEHYIDAWVAISKPDDWTPEDIERLKVYQRERREAQRRDRFLVPTTD